MLAVNAHCMSFVDNHERIVQVRDPEQVSKRCDFAIHAVEALDYDPDPPGSCGEAPVANCAFDSLRIVMGTHSKRCSSRSRSFMNTGVNQRIKDEQVVLLRQPCQHSNIPPMTEFIHHSLSNDGRRKTPNWQDRVFPRWLVGFKLAGWDFLDQPAQCAA